jgi:hypothetical protein
LWIQWRANISFVKSEIVSGLTKKKRKINADTLPVSKKVFDFMYDGYVFFCNKSTQQQCLSRKHYTCMDEKKPTEPIKEGSVIFLYNVDDKSLLGPFTALTEGADELDAGTWAMDVDERIPSEDIKVTWEDLHIIKNAPAQMPFLGNPKTCRLSTTETQRALDLLKQGELYLYTKKE